MTWIIFWYKISNQIFSFNEFYVVLKLRKFQILGCDIPSGTTQGMGLPTHGSKFIKMQCQKNYCCNEEWMYWCNPSPLIL